jgi:hypothetical protein
MIALSMQAQVISGKLADAQTGESLPFANAVLLQAADSSFVKGVVSDENGLFAVELPQGGACLLRISYIGYESLTVDARPGDYGTLRLSPGSQALGEVVVTTAQTPPFRAGDNGGIVANVSATLLSTVGTAADVLQRMPGIAAEDGKITVFGKGAPIVYINNRKVNDLSEIERLESSDISTVELINNPGAVYDAEGRAVLLIKTKKKMNGFSAQLAERLRRGAHWGDNENLSLSYTQNSLNLFAGYYHNYSKREATENHTFNMKNPDALWSHTTLIPGYRYANNTQEISAGFDLSINTRHAIGGQYQFYTNDHSDEMNISTSTRLNGAPYETSLSETASDGYYYQHQANAFYSGEFGERFSLRFDFDFLNNYEDATQRSDETVNDTGKNAVLIANRTDYSLYAGKLTNSYKSAAGLIEFGGEYNYIDGNGFVHGNGYADDSEFTNTEQKTAAFLSYSRKLSALSVAAGVRYEFTSEHHTEGSERTPVTGRTYSDFYPNISLSAPIGKASLSLAFNKRTQRPSFSQLNGNVVYVNRFVFQKGNPYLSKTNIYDVNLQATLKPFYLNVGYSYLKDVITLFFEEQKNTDNALLLTSANFPKLQNLNATLNFNHRIAFWQPNYTAGVEQPFFSAMYDGREVAYNRLNYFFRAYNDFTLPPGFVLSANFRYQSDRQNAFFESASYRQIDLGLRKNFLNNTLRLNLMVYDVFNRVDEANDIRLNNLQWHTDKKSETRYATLSVTWMFNNYQKKYRGSSAAQDDINRF